MTTAKIIVIPGSTRSGSFNTRLGGAIANELSRLGATATRVNLADYPLPIFNQDDEAKSGAPENARKLATLIAGHHGVVLVNPEYNGSFSGLMKNTLDWLSRDVGVKVYQNRAFALAACSPGGLGGIRVLSHARDNLVSVGADVITPQLAVGNAHSAFDDDGNLIGERPVGLLQNMAGALIERAKLHVG